MIAQMVTAKGLSTADVAETTTDLIPNQRAVKLATLSLQLVRNLFICWFIFTNY